MVPTCWVAARRLSGPARSAVSPADKPARVGPGFTDEQLAKPAEHQGLIVFTDPKHFCLRRREAQRAYLAAQQSVAFPLAREEQVPEFSNGAKRRLPTPSQSARPAADAAGQALSSVRPSTTGPNRPHAVGVSALTARGQAGLLRGPRRSCRADRRIHRWARPRRSVRRSWRRSRCRTATPTGHRSRSAARSAAEGRRRGRRCLGCRR